MNTILPYDCVIVSKKWNVYLIGCMWVGLLNVCLPNKPSIRIVSLPAPLVWSDLVSSVWLLTSFYAYVCLFVWLLPGIIIIYMLLFICGVIDVNPGPRNQLIISHSNIKSLYVNNSDIRISELHLKIIQSFHKMKALFIGHKIDY